MDSAIDMLTSKITGKRVSIRKQYRGELHVIAVGGELRQVFSNLLSNSLDAVDQKGTIELRLSRSTCVNSRQQRIRVTIADNGKGINAITLPRIFEPLFTTKESTGSGLGLWVCKQLIDKHHGSIRMRSSTDAGHRGTVFSVLLPADAEPRKRP
jgi:signal transduction histidine kinase